MAALQHIKDADADTTTLKLLTNDGTGMQTALTIDSSGNVGIGSSSPSGTFHISSGTSGDCVLILEADTDNNNEDDNPRIEFKQDGGVSHSAITNGNNELRLYNSSNSGSIRFYVGTDEGYENGIPRAYFSYNDENVGSLYLLNNRSTSVSSGSKLGEILFRGHSAQDSSDTSPVSIYGEADGDVTSTTHAGAIVLATASTGTRRERMRVTKDGYVGINDDSPISELSVAGKIAITSIQGSTPTAPTDANHGWLYTKSDGKIYWQSNGLSERDLTGSGDSGTFNTLTVGSGSDTGILQSNGDYNLQLKTGNTDTGSITIEDGIDGDINILTNGSGEIDLTTTGLIDIYGATINLKTTANISSALYLNTQNGGALWLDSSGDIFVDAIRNIDLRQRTHIDVSSKNYSPNADGLILHIDELTMTDNSTAASGTASEDFKFVKVDVPTLNSSNSSVTTTNASTFYIQGAPEDTGNMTITNPYALYVNSGNSYLGGNVGIGTSDPQALLHCQSSASNTSGALEGLNQIALILSNNDNDHCALAMNTSNYSLAFLFRDGAISSHTDFTEMAWLQGNVDVDALDFTGQHKNLMNQNIDTTKVGLIVSATNNHINLDNSVTSTINESLPYCVLANTDNDKKVFGVISNKEDTNTSREYSTGRFVSAYKKTNTNEQRLFINSVGEGSIWVCNKNGTLDNGDYITSTTVTGYGGKQSDDILHNYTVAKITRDCDFSLTKIVKQKLKVITSTDSDGNTTTSIDYDANGDVQYEDDLDETGNQQMVYPLETRFLQADGTQLTDEAEYNTRLGNGEEVYIACFVGCTYHCG